jgi:cytochrome b561
MNGAPSVGGVSVSPVLLRCKLARVMVVVFVCLTAAVSLAWSHAKLFSQDEMYEFQTDSVASLAKLIHVQKTYPISLDPLLYHALSHGAMQVFGAGEFAQRLPALLGFLLMQGCLFFFVRKMAGDRAGLVAAAFPATTATLFYSAEGRPYGLLLGLYALALVSWQAATRGREQGTGNRAWALVGLAVAIAATLNAHYFGVLLLVPVCAAEGWRTLERRKIDWALVGAIVIGIAGVVTTRPFMKAAGEFRTHYYNGGAVGLHDISRAYRTLFVDYTKMSMPAQHAWMGVLVAFAALLSWGCWRVAGEVRGETAGVRDVVISRTEWVLLLTLAALPFGGYLLARFVTHSIEVRYVLGAVVALSAMVAIALAPLLRRDTVFNAALVVLGLGIVVGGVVRIRAEQRKTAERLTSLVLPAEVRSALLASADGRLYVQDMGAFEEDRYYEPDADVKPRMTLVYSAAEELRWNRHDTMALTAMHLQRFTDLPVVAYEEVKAQPGEHVFLMQHSGWDWTDQAFEQDGAAIRPLGKAMSGDIAAVRFR